MTTPMRTTPLTSEHEAAGARLGPFAGWRMPISFAGTLAEHQAVRDDVGVFDVSHLGTVWITGGDAVTVAARSFTNDATTLDDGTSQYSLCCDEDGGIIDDLIVYRLATDRLLTIPNAANTDAVVARLRQAAHGLDASVEDASADWAVLAVQGPRSLALVERALGVDPAATPWSGVRTCMLDGHDAVLARTGYTGEPGCELVVPGDAAVGIWRALREEGAAPVGLAARDTLRLEMGYPLHGNDIDRTTHPYEARLGWAVKLDRAGFVGQDALRERKAEGPSRRLWGIRTDGRRPPRQGMQVRQAGRDVGTVTSGSFSPTAGVGIGLAYLADPIGPGDEVVVDVRGTDVAFEVVRPPFVDRDPKGQEA